MSRYWWMLCVGFSVVPLSVQKQNVCKTLPDYKFISANKNCFFNPDVLSTLPRMVKRHGYPLENHKVTTEDGYILTLHRIHHHHNSSRQPILIQHGLAASAAAWVLRGQDALAFSLADKGYDVWLSNIRGVVNSRRHVKLDSSHPPFWNFGFHEMGTHDLPAITEYIARATGQRGNIVYIGHSMGTTMSYIYCSLLKAHCDDHLRGLIHLSPVAFLGGINPILRAFAQYVDPLQEILHAAGFFAIGDRPSLNYLTWRFCSTYPTISICAASLALTTGLSLEEENVGLLPVFASYLPTGTSVKTLVHFAQLILTNQFRQFDYRDGNLERYNSTEPPTYDLSAISLPVYMFIGRNDLISNEREVEMILSRLTSVPDTGRYYFNYAHNDFFLARHVDHFYRALLEVINRMNNV